MTNLKKHTKAPDSLMDSVQFGSFFLAHLNRIYCAKTHLYERLPALAWHANFKDLKHAILETHEDIGRQIARMEEVYVLLDEEPPATCQDELLEFVEKGFAATYQHKDALGISDLSIVFYLSLIESIELASFQILDMAAANFPDKSIIRLLQENFDDSKADRILFLQITAIYIA